MLLYAEIYKISGFYCKSLLTGLFFSSTMASKEDNSVDTSHSATKDLDFVSDDVDSSRKSHKSKHSHSDRKSSDSGKKRSKGKSSDRSHVKSSKKRRDDSYDERSKSRSPSRHRHDYDRYLPVVFVVWVPSYKTVFVLFQNSCL